MKTRQKLAVLASATMLLGTPAAVLADAQYDYAKVISAQPKIRQVTVTTPVKECWEETQNYTVNRNAGGSVGSTIFGAIVGGVVGHQFGSGHGNDAATVAGSLIGAAIGNDVAKRRNGAGVEQHSRPVQRCETRYQESREERIDGYRVTYRFNGQKYVTDMPYDPGETIRVRVDVRPAR
jgi:uncharacterized protein YcfJ